MAPITTPDPPLMTPDDIYAKTELGVQELRERKLNLSIALRSLLILVGFDAATPIVNEMEQMIKSGA
jgi:hypothetical protein